MHFVTCSKNSHSFLTFSIQNFSKIFPNKSVKSVDLIIIIYCNFDLKSLFTLTRHFLCFYVIFFHNKNYQYDRVQKVRTFFLTKWLYIPPKELALKSSLHFIKYLVIIFQAVYFFLKLIALSKVIKIKKNKIFDTTCI